jgi:hypothetical protein
MVRIARSFAVVLVVVSVGLVASLPGTSFAESSASHLAKKKPAIATLAVEKPNVSVKQKGSDTFEPATDGQKLRQGDTVQTDATGRATVNYTDAAYTRLDVNTTFTIAKLTEEKGARQIEGSLDTGRTWNRTEALTESGSFEESGAGATAAVTGTAFSVECHLVPKTDASAAPEKVCSFLGVHHQIVLRSENGEVRDIPEFGECTSTQPTEKSPGDLCDTVHQLTPDEMAAIAWIQENLLRDLNEHGFGPGPISVTVQGTLQVQNGQFVSFTPTSAPVTTTTTTSTSSSPSTPPIIPPPPPVIDATNPVGLAPYVYPCGAAVAACSASLPVGFTPSPEITAEDEQPVTFVVNVTDPSGLPMTVQFTDLPDNGVICAPMAGGESGAFPCTGTGAVYGTVVGYQAITSDAANPYNTTTQFAADTVFVFAPNDEPANPDSQTTLKVTNSAGQSATADVPVTVTEDPCEFGGCGTSASSSETPSPSVMDPSATDPSPTDPRSGDTTQTTAADTAPPKPDATTTTNSDSAG